MAVQGLVRYRKHQFGRQADLGTKVAAARAYPFKGVPSVDPTWTDPDIDEGSIHRIAAPYRGPGEFTASLTDPSLKYNNLPLMFSGFFGGGVTGTPGAGDLVTWSWDPASITIDEPDVHTYQFGDDVLSDWYQLGDGLIETFEITASRDPDGPLTASHTWRFGTAANAGFTDSPVFGTVPTAGLSVATNDAILYLKDAGIYIASAFGDLATSQVSNALHAFTLRGTNTWDLKRYANGAQLFDIDAYALAGQEIELECTWAKTADTVGLGSESDAWFSDTAVTRYVQIPFVSTVEIGTGVPYTWTPTMPMRYYTRTDQEVGGNAVVVLNGHAFYEPTTADIFMTNVVECTLDSLDGVGS